MIKTSDFYLTAYLLARSILLQDSYTDGKRMVFSFIETENANDLMNEFYRSQGQVEPSAYANAIRALKSLIYSNSNKNEDKYYEQNNSTKLS